jgi:hypothetical protein
MEKISKSEPIPEHWQKRFNSLATDLESIVVHIRQSEEYLRAMRRELEEDEEEFAEYIANLPAETPEEKEFIELEKIRHEGYMKRQNIPVADLERSLQSLEAMRLAKLKAFEELKATYNGETMQ